MTPVVPVVTTFFALVLGIDVFRVRSIASWAKVLGIFVTVGGAMGLVALSPNTSAASGAADLVRIGRGRETAVCGGEELSPSELQH